MTIIWHPMDRPPVIEAGEEIRVLVAYRSKSRDHQSSSEAYYLNDFTLVWDDDGACKSTGWFDRYEDVDGSATYRAISDEFIEHLGWTPMPAMYNFDADGFARKDMARELLVIRLRAMATIQAQMAAALIGKGQDELRKHFNDSANMLTEAHKALEADRG